MDGDEDEPVMDLMVKHFQFSSNGKKARDFSTHSQLKKYSLSFSTHFFGNRYGRGS